MDKSQTSPLQNTPADNCDVVRRLLSVISRRSPFSVADELLDDNLLAYMDGKKIGRGKTAWFRWVRFLHHNADKKMDDLAVDIGELINDGDKVVANVRWRGAVNNAAVFSAFGKAVYRVQNGKVVAVWTRRKNYVFIYGDAFADNVFAFYWLLARLFIWRCPPSD